MGFLQRLLSLISTRLRDVNASQRVALIMGGALVGLSLLWLMQWAATPERTPLLDQAFAGEELARVEAALRGMGEDYTIENNRVMVAASANRSAILARLQQEGSLPSNTSAGIAALVKESDPWISQEENNRRWTWAVQNELQRILSQFQGVKEAHVVLNFNTQQRSFTRQAPPTSASVTLVMKDEQPAPRSLALAAAKLVAGAVAGMNVRNVQVLDASGRSALDWDVEQDPASAIKAARAQEEARFTDLIRRQIADPRALVSVRVELNSTASSVVTKTPSKGVERSSETTSEQRTNARASESPGVQPNVGMAVGGGKSDENETRETQRTEFETGVASKTETRPAGDVETVTAAIALSVSYLEAVYRGQNPTATDPPDEPTLERVFQAERTRLASQVAKLVKPPTEDNVAISRYYDAAAIAPIAVAGGGVLDESVDLAKRYAPQGALGLLALLSIGLMLKMAKRRDVGDSFGIELGLPKEAIEAARKAADDVAKAAAKAAQSSRHGGGGGGGGGMMIQSAGVQPTPGSAVPGGVPVADVVTMPVGQATATEGVLVAQEVDANAVQTRKMLEQIQHMTDSDADVVSTLVEQWVVRNEQYHEDTV